MRVLHFDGRRLTRSARAALQVRFEVTTAIGASKLADSIKVRRPWNLDGLK